MKRLKLNKLNVLLSIIGVISLLFILCFNMPLAHASSADPNYIYFDLSAGTVEIDNSTYKGTIYQTNDGVTSTLTVTGTHNKANKYYVYQSSTSNRKTTGLVDGNMIIPDYDPIKVGDVLWKDYITNNTDILGIIDEWNTQTSGIRQSTENQILIGVSNNTCNLTIDNIWSTLQSRGKIDGGSISVTGAATSGTHVTINLKGDNRLGSLRYYSNVTNYRSTLTINSYLGDKSVEGSLTVIGSQAMVTNNGNYTLVPGSSNKNNVAANHWDSVIGGVDSKDPVRGIIFKGGTVYAGSTPRENSTAIGGGGNGIGNVKIDGGDITAVAHTTGTAIGGGIAHTSYGGSSDVVINDGRVFAYNFGQPAHDVIANYGSGASQALIKAAMHIPGTAIGGASSIILSGNKETAVVTINGGYVYAESLGGCGIGAGNSVNTTAGSAKVTINGGTVIANSKGQTDYTFDDGEKIDIKPGVSIGGGTGGIKGDGGYADITITGGKIITGSIGGGNTRSSTNKIGYANINISGGDISGQFIMVKGASEPCQFNMTNGIIHNSDTSDTLYARLQENGGAVYMDDPNGIATITGGTIENCKAENGGAIYMTAGKFTIDGTGKINNCSANNLGGAIYLGQSGSYKGTVYMNDGTISNNKALSSNGGAIYLDGGNAFISGGDINANQSLKGGGAYLAGGTLNVSGGNIDSNKAQDGAGAFLARGELNITGGYIKQNIASNYGGGAFLTGGTLNVTGGTIDANKALDGAGAYLAGGELNISSGAISNNIASNNGGGAYLAEGGTLNVTGGNINKNKAQDGAGAYLAGGKLNISNGMINENTATNDGAGAYLAGGILNVTGGSIDSNIATNGAGAYLAGGTLNISSGSITNNNASLDGGGAYLEGGTLNVNGGSIDRNDARNGAGAYVNAGDIVMTNGSFDQNIASVDGGGAYLAGGNLNVSGGTFTGNKAYNNGGGAYLTGGNLKVTGGSFTSNEATYDGGGAYLAGGDFELNGASATFKSNIANNGAGVYLTGGIPNLFVGTLEENIASSCGGGIYIDKQLVNLEPTGSVKIIKNKAGYLSNGAESTFDGFGGAIYIGGTQNKDDACFKVNKDKTGTVLIDQNIAKSNGGGVCINNGYFTMDGENVTVTNNEAENGGGVAVMAGDFNISNGSIGEEYNANIATNGGGVYVSGGNVLVTEEGSIKNNIAEVNGGGAYIANGNFTMIGGTVENNIANTGNGGGLYVSANLQNVTVEVLSGSFSNNQAKVSGGAIAVVGNTGGTEDITVTLGVNKTHFDEEGNKVECDHGNGVIHATTCPEIIFNKSGGSGGAIYITGGKSTKLNMFCLEEEQNSVTDDESRSHFMMVEGGTVVISTLEEVTSGDDTNGNSVINNSIHVTAGAMDLYGSMNNPRIDAPITVDITSNEDHYADHRESGNYYKLQYFENFHDTSGNVTGQYTVYQIKHGDSHTISGVIYNHPGYEIIGWYTNDDGTGTKYEVGQSYLFDNDPIGDLIIYAIWQAHSYFVEFSANIPAGTAYIGQMDKVQYNYNTKYTLPDNAYIYKGYIFTGWKDKEGNSYINGAVVINLTDVDGETIVLYAQWEICDHTDEGYYTYTADANIIYKECNCLAHTETATLKEVSTVYDEKVHHTSVEYSHTNWNLAITYTKDGVSITDPINAGTYIASVATNGVMATSTVFIDKATQVAPDKPTYKVVSDGTGSNNIITVDQTVAQTGKTYEYHIEWYNGGVLCTEDPAWKLSNSFTLAVSFTNYYVYIRYAESENYYASAPVRADLVYYFTGDVSIHIICPDEISFTLTELPDKGGIRIDVSAKEGYFLTKDFNVTTDKGSINEVTIRQTYNLISIPAEGDVYVTIAGFKGTSSVKGFVTENEIFENFTTTSASISRDSAFTARFTLSNVSDYSNYVINFSVALPTNTSILYINVKTNTYYYKLMDNNTTSSISLNALTLLFDDVDQSIETDEEFIFIVNFAQTLEGFNQNSLTVWLTADKDPLEVELPNLPETEVEATLNDVTNDLQVATDTTANSLEKHLTYAYAKSLGENSKFATRQATLKFIPRSDLPVDARLNVVIGEERTTYYQNVEGNYVIPLNINVEDIYVTLESDMFDIAKTDYVFEIVLISSKSMSSIATENGTILKSVELTFTKNETVEPSLNVTTNKDAYKVNDKATVSIEYENIPDEAVITLTLMLKDENGRYSSTGWSTIITKNEEQKETLEVSLAGQQAGSYTFTCVVKDETGITIISVPCYFIIYN